MFITDINWKLVKKIWEVIMGLLFGALPVKVKVKVETRDMTVASGDVEYTGYGFKPKLVLIDAFHPVTKAASWGRGDNIYCNCIYKKWDDNWDTDLIQAVYIVTASGDAQVALVKEFTSDGFILTWTKSNSPTNTANLYVTAIG